MWNYHRDSRAIVQMRHSVGLNMPYSVTCAFDLKKNHTEILRNRAP